MEKAVGMGKARTMVVLRSRTMQRSSILMMKSEWKWLVGKICLFHRKEVASQRTYALVAYNTCSMALSPNMTRAKDFGSIYRLY